MSDSPTTPEMSSEEPHADEPQAKATFEEPKLRFIEPQLTQHGDATQITQGGFFGTFG